MAPPRTAPRGAAARGGAAPRGRGRGGIPTSASSSNTPNISSHVTTVAVKRPSYGKSGRPLAIYANLYKTTVPEKIIHHYDASFVLAVVIASDKNLPARLNTEIINALQNRCAPDIFNPKAVYDGRKNLFSVRDLFNGEPSRKFDVTLSDATSQAQTSGRPPKVFKVTLTKAAEINPEVLARFIQGDQSNDNAVATAIMALNVVIRMEPSLRYPFNVRSFFTNRETKAIGSGIVLWRGYFQSVRPAIGHMLINVDISTGMMYKDGPLINLCLEFLGQPGNNPNLLSMAAGFPPARRHNLQRFVTGVRVQTKPNAGQPQRPPRVIKRLSDRDANQITFSPRDGQTMTVANYFAQSGRALTYPKIICAEVGNGALIPLELLTVVPGQIMRKQVPPERTKDVVEFATKPPAQRLASIREGLNVLNYNNSPYLNQFGMTVDTDADLLKVDARVLNPPVLKYGPGSKSIKVQPKNGSWNMMEKRFYKPSTIRRWIVVIFERQQRFNDATARELTNGLLTAFRECGIVVTNPQPKISWAGNPNTSVSQKLRDAGKACFDEFKEPPSLIVVVLPDGGNDIYQAVKHFGDITMGVATQCLKSNKCSRAKMQYFANVCLKINVKLGGINTIPDPELENVLTDPNNPTIVMGADVIHPAPGSEGRPSFSALVGNVDSETAKYVAEIQVQEPREEMIADLRTMAKGILEKYIGYRRGVEKKSPGQLPPKRIIFYRDGVSEGQFQQVLDKELPELKAACAELGIKPLITIIIVGKRHHIRFFPRDPRDGDKLGNCPAGTVVDREVGHPTDFDFYLQSHGGLLGTSRPAHYSILYDENKFSPDALQNLSFALCHVYARSTRSVSIPAPVYYADIVCSRAKNHFDPSKNLNLEGSDSLSTTGAGDVVQAFKSNFLPLHRNQKLLMYFS